MQHNDIQRRSLLERVFHAVCFEGIATAMIWNIIYNALFDRVWPAHLLKRTARVRALHALGFECGFIVIGVSIVAYVLRVSLLQAFTLEIGFFLFFLPYTMLYNWMYDTLRARIVKRRQQRVTA